MYIKKEERLLCNQYITVRKCMYNIKAEFLQLFQKILLMIMRHTQR